jgi:hypothetical protein
VFSPPENGFCTGPDLSISEVMSSSGGLMQCFNSTSVAAETATSAELIQPVYRCTEVPQKSVLDLLLPKQLQIKS